MRKDKEIKMATLHSHFFIYLVGSGSVKSFTITRSWYTKLIPIGAVILSHKATTPCFPVTSSSSSRDPAGTARCTSRHGGPGRRRPWSSSRPRAPRFCTSRRRGLCCGSRPGTSCCGLWRSTHRRLGHPGHLSDASSSNETLHPFFFSIGLKKSSNANTYRLSGVAAWRSGKLLLPSCRASTPWLIVI